VTLPAQQILQTEVSTDNVGGPSPGPFKTFLQDTFTVRSVLGSTIFFQCQGDILHQGQNTVTPTIRLLFNNTIVLDQFDGVPDTAIRRNTRFGIAAATATGLDQTFDFKWQIQSSNSNSGVNAKVGTQALRIAFKR
jgi:hypothetical protein